MARLTPSVETHMSDQFLFILNKLNISRYLQLTERLNFSDHLIVTYKVNL